MRGDVNAVYRGLSRIHNLGFDSLMTLGSFGILKGEIVEAIDYLKTKTQAREISFLLWKLVDVEYTTKYHLNYSHYF